MSTIRAALAAALLLAGACFWERKPMEEAVISYENLTPRDVEGRVRGRLSENGRLEFIAERQIRVTDYRENVHRIANAIENADRSPFTAVLHFQLIHGTQDGPVDERVVPIAAALRDVVRFKGFEVLGEQTLSAQEGDSESRDMEMVKGRDQYEVSAEVVDVRATNTREGSVELTVRLRRENRNTMLTTNVVVPVGNSVVLGRTHPDDVNEAVLLVVRPELDVAERSEEHKVSVRVRPQAIEHAVDTALSAHAAEIAAHAKEVAKMSAEAALLDAVAQVEALQQLRLDQLRIQFEQGRLTSAQYEERKREIMAEREARPTRATAAPRATTPTRRPPPA